MLDYDNIIGKVVCSKAGRDTGKIFIITGVIDKNYVYISDGRLRKFDKPKKKKLKHLILTDEVAKEVAQLIMLKNNVSNEKIRSYLENMEANKEG